MAAAAAKIDSEGLLQAFAEPTRLRLLGLLIDGETCVCDLVAALRLPQPAVSRHLAVLRGAGLVRGRRDGKWIWYSLAPAGSSVHRKLLECLEACRAEIPAVANGAARCCALRERRTCC